MESIILTGHRGYPANLAKARSPNLYKAISKRHIAKGVLWIPSNKPKIQVISIQMSYRDTLSPLNVVRKDLISW